MRRRGSSAVSQETKVARLTRELNEAVEQQTATSEVLRVISRSQFNLQSVLQSVAETAARLSRSDGAVIFQLENGVYRFAAGYSLVPAFLEIERRTVISPGPGTVIGRAAMTREVARIDDAWTDPLYEKKEDAKIEGNRSMIGVPLLRDGEPVVVIGLGRRRLDPFGEREIEMATTFAAQAVIAIENARLVSELRDSLQQQTATADVLKVISRSIFDLQTVLDTLVESAARLCNAERTFIYRPKDGSFHHAASYGYPKDFREFIAKTPLQSGRGSVVGRTALEKTVIHVTDTLADPEFSFVRPPNLRPSRTLLGVPLIREGTLIGVMGLARPVVKAFNAKEIELATIFADQAVIAIENTRLFEAEHQRTRELSESLEQQTATSEVLRVISSSPGELEPVFEAMLENAVRICDAKFGLLFLSEGDAFRAVALHDAPPAYAEVRRREPVTRFGPGTATDRAARTKQPVQIADIKAESAYLNDPQRFAFVDLAGGRTVVAVPMLKENELVGVIGIYRQEVRPFTDKQIELVKNFAAQAVIAIENARLLNELRQRTTDLSEAFEQQKATSDLLQVISSSPGTLQPVFQAMLENAVRICGATFGNMFLYEDDAFRAVAMYNAPEAYGNARARAPFHPPPDSGLGRLVATKEVVQIADLRTEERYINRDPFTVAGVKSAGIRTLLEVPMLKEGRLVGCIVIYRQEVAPFSYKQIELVENFASQVVIAIENARLLNELRQRTTDLTGRTADLTEALEQQTATSEVLQVISSSPGDLEPVQCHFAKCRSSAAPKIATLWIYENGQMRRAAAPQRCRRYADLPRDRARGRW